MGVPEQPAGLRCVDLDFHEAGRLAVDELVETNHDHVICLGYPAEAMGRDLTYVRRFMQSVRERADEHGLRLDVVAPVEAGRAGATVAVDRTLSSHDRGRLGLIVPAPHTVQPVLHALGDRGLAPGRDISVIGVSTDAAAQETMPPVTNVSLEPRDVSRRAMKALFWLLEPTVAGPPAHGRPRLPAALAARHRDGPDRIPRTLSRARAGGSGVGPAPLSIRIDETGRAIPARPQQRAARELAAIRRRST